MLSLFTIKPTEKNMQIARAARIYYKQDVYAKPEQKQVEQAEQKKPVEAIEKKPEQKKPVAEQKKPVEQAEQKKPVDQKKPVEAVEKKPVEQAEQKKPVDQKKPVEAVEKKPESKPVAEKKPEAKAEQKKPEDKKSETKAEQKKPEDKKSAEKPVTEQKKPDIEVLDRDGNIVAMLPGVPEEAPKAARTTGFDINNFVKPKQSKQQASEFRDTKNIDEVYGFMRSAGVPGPFDPMPGFSLNEKVAVLKKYANFNGTHPGLDVLQINTLIMVFNSPDLSRKMVNCGLDPKQVLGVRKFNEVPATKYDSNDVYDFAFEYSISKKKKLVLLLNSIPTYDPKNGWMSAYNISVR